MERMPNEALENAIDVYKFAMETCLKNKVEDYVPTLDKATISFLEELKAYRDAEEQGLLLRLPCKVGDIVWTWKYPTRVDKEDGSTWTICDKKRATVVSVKFTLRMLDGFGDLYFLTKEEAEQKLAEIRGDNNV